MLKDFFGFYPGVTGLPVKNPDNLDFTGKLYHVLYGGEYYTLVAERGTIEMKKE